MKLKELRRRELLAKYPDATLLKNWVSEMAERLGIGEFGVRMRVARGQIQPRIVKLSTREQYVVDCV